MQAIQTTFLGVRYRSRTEARWAAFFTYAGIAFEYEPLGVVVGGKPYLPDFRLPALKIWVEVKGGEPAEDEIQKAMALQNESGLQVLFACGSPSVNGFPLRSSDGRRKAVFLACRECHGTWIEMHNDRYVEWSHLGAKAERDCLGDLSVTTYAEAVAKANNERFGVHDA